MTATNRAQLWRFAAVAVVLGLPLVMIGLAIGNLAEATTARAVAARQETTAAQIIRQVAQRQNHRLKPRDTAALYLATDSPSLARAELQERAGRFVAAAGGHLEEAQFTSSPEQEADGTVALQLSLTIGNAGLRDLLYSIETGTPLLDATDMSVRPTGSDTAGGIGHNDLLHVDLTVQGHFRKGTG